MDVRPGPQSRARYFAPLGRLADYPPAHPERSTLRDGRGVLADVEIRQWPSVGAMQTAVRMARSGVNPNNLRPYRREDR